MSQEIELLTEIRDLLQVMAEPALVERDQKFREAILAIAGKSQKSASAIMLMDGSRTQSDIINEVRMDSGNLSRLVKLLHEGSLITADERHPKLRIKLPKNFFNYKGKTNE